LLAVLLDINEHFDETLMKVLRAMHFVEGKWASATHVFRKL
jgi:hypothetical protein